jgi:hypothetical protein
MTVYGDCRYRDVFREWDAVLTHFGNTTRLSSRRAADPAAAEEFLRLYHAGLYWRSLRVRDRRYVISAEQVAAEAVAHLREATNGGRIRPTVTVLAASTPERDGPAIWNEQLIRYAGYRLPDETVVGDPVATGRLGAVQRDVGPFEQLLDGDGVAGVVGAQAGAHGHHPGRSRGVADGQLLHRRPDALHRDPRGLGGLLGQHDQELLAPVAVDAVAGAQLPPDPVGHRAQRLVPGVVPKAVVEGLEPVGVAHGQVVAAAMAAAAGVQRPQILLQRQPVAEPGEPCLGLGMVHLRVAPLALLSAAVVPA